ncbi:MAG: hypothetical protein EHM61_25495 [Acidobacteria bacterium]|nr:MAG: hypothetical protein EHM61_25495 [Acidobacteriota bacterium]
MPGGVRKVFLHLVRFAALVLVTSVTWSATLKSIDPFGGEGPTRLAREYRGTIWTLPNCRVDYTQAVIRTAGRNFFLKLELLDGATFDAAVEPALGTPTGSSFRVLHHAVAGGDCVEWHVLIESSFTDFPTFTISFAGISVDVGSRIRSGSSIAVRVSARESETGVPLETPVSQTLLQSAPGVSLLGFLPGSQKIDVAQGRRWFIEPFLVFDMSPKLAITTGKAFRHTGEPIADTPGILDKLELTILGNLTRIEQFEYGGARKLLMAEEQTGSSIEFSVPYGDLVSVLDVPTPFLCVLAGYPPFDRLDPRTLSITAVYNFRDHNYDDVPILTGASLTTWSLNGTLLTANWVNGNTDVFTSWVFLKNETSMKGVVEVEVFSLPRFGTPSVSLGVLDLGLIQPNGLIRVNLGEHILRPLNIPTPYLENGGNLALEFVLAVADATGAVRVFGEPNLSFGTYPMNKVANGESGRYYVVTPGPAN